MEKFGGTFDYKMIKRLVDRFCGSYRYMERIRE
jgi:hypothetical protein